MIRFLRWWKVLGVSYSVIHPLTFWFQKIAATTRDIINAMISKITQTRRAVYRSHAKAWTNLTWEGRGGCRDITWKFFHLWIAATTHRSMAENPFPENRTVMKDPCSSPIKLRITQQGCMDCNFCSYDLLMFKFSMDGSKINNVSPARNLDQEHLKTLKLGNAETCATTKRVPWVVNGCHGWSTEEHQ